MTKKRILIIFIVLLFTLLNSQAQMTVVNIERVSINNSGIEGNNGSSQSAISADGRFVAFGSAASNLVDNDTNGTDDIFVYDRTNDTIERVSVNNNGIQGNSYSYIPAISADGRFVAFWSYASDLVANDTNGTDDIFVYDRTTDTIERVSVNNSGIAGNGYSYYPAISADGRFVAFESFASNMVANDTNGTDDIFVYDRTNAMIERVSVNNSGIQGNSDSHNSAISADGRFVTFESDASNLVANDTNGYRDIFVYDRTNATIERVSINNNGIQGNSYSYNHAISADGRFVTFRSDANNLVANDTNGSTDIFVYDRTNATIERVSVNNSGIQGNADSYSSAAISADGRFVAFESYASNLVANDTNGIPDVFVYDRTNATIERVSVNNSDIQGNSFSFRPAISADGRFVAFESFASNMVANDTNGDMDIFVVELSHPFVSEITFEELNYPSRQWLETDVSYAGNPIRISFSIEDRLSYTLYDDSTGQALQATLEDTYPAPNQAGYRTYVYQWDTTDYAWESTSAHSERPIRVDVVSNGNVVQTFSRNFTVYPRPVVFMHGLNSTASTWSAYQGETGFLATVNPNWESYAVNTMNTGGSGQLETYTYNENARAAYDYMENVRAQTGAWEIDVVAHSMGGLFTRYIIHHAGENSSWANPQVLDSKRSFIKNLIMIGTPNNGQACAALMSAGSFINSRTGEQIPKISETFPVPSTLELEPAYVFFWVPLYLNWRASNFVVIANDDRPFTCGEGSNGGLGIAGDGVVSKFSAFWLWGEVEEDDPTTYGITELTPHTQMTESQEIFNTMLPYLTGSANLGAMDSPLTITPPRNYPSTLHNDETQVAIGDGVTVPANGTITHPMQIPITDGFTAVVATSPNISLRLIQPNGSTHATLNANERPAEAFYHPFMVQNPAIGTWQIEFINTSATDEPALISVQYQTDAIELTQQASAENDYRVTVSATLQNGDTPITNAQITTVLTDDTGNEYELSLTHELNGQYSATSSEILPEGVLTVNTVAQFNGQARSITGSIRIVYMERPPTEWTAEYFNNTSLSGNPNLVRVESDIDFDWGTGTPDVSITNNYTARFTTTESLQPGTYALSLSASGGVRFSVNGDILLYAFSALAVDEVLLFSVGEDAYEFVLEYADTANQAALDFNLRHVDDALAQDVNKDGLVSPVDAIYVINRIGSADLTADVDGNGAVEASDVNYILEYMGN